MYQLEKGDECIVERIRCLGLRNIARDSGVSPSMLSRFLRLQCPMSLDLWSKVNRSVIKLEHENTKENACQK